MIVKMKPVKHKDSCVQVIRLHCASLEGSVTLFTMSQQGLQRTWNL